MAMGAVTSLMVMMTMASMMIFNLMTKMILIIGNANYDDKDENDDDNLVLQGPDGRGYITQPFSGPSYSPGRSDLPILCSYHRDDHNGNEDELIERFLSVVHAIQQIATQALHTLPTLVSTSSSSST